MKINHKGVDVGMIKSFYFAEKDKKIIDRLEKVAKEKERSESWLVKKALEKYLKSDIDE